MHVFAFADGYLSGRREIRLRAAAERGVPAGFAVSRDGGALWVAEVWGQRVLQVSTADGGVRWQRAFAPPQGARQMLPEDNRVLAYYEAGHAIVRHSMPQCDPVHKVSIVARGLSGGYVMRLPDEESGLMPKSKFEDEITARLGGRASEEITFGNVTTRASEDMERATKAARAMVTQYGMSERLGPLTFGDKEELVFLGREIGEQRNYSDAVAEKIDREVQRIINHAYERAKSVLLAQREQLEQLANLLLEKETVERSEFEALFNQAPAAAV